jgi:RNA polymerase sigma factor (TIGR02999 family)
MKPEGLQDSAASDRLLKALYPELKRLAAGLMRRERAGLTLQATALVHEAYMKLVDGAQAGWESRGHFLGIAARAMRQILVDHARSRAAAKRGGGWQRITLDTGLGPDRDAAFEILALHDALDRLAAVDPRAARGVELRVFGGMTVEETAQVLGVSRRTVDADWAMARMWLARELGDGAAAKKDGS